MNIQNGLFFLCVFSTLFILKVILRLLGSLFGQEVVPLTNRELIFLNLAISYVITYFIKL